MDDFVEVIATATGRIERVPRHFLDDPFQQRHFVRTPGQLVLDGEPDSQPDKTWTVAALSEVAQGLGIDPTSLKSKAQLLDAIEAVRDQHTADQAATAAADVVTTTPDPGGTQPTDETPASGEQE